MSLRVAKLSKDGTRAMLFDFGDDGSTKPIGWRPIAEAKGLPYTDKLKASMKAKPEPEPEDEEPKEEKKPVPTKKKPESEDDEPEKKKTDGDWGDLVAVGIVGALALAAGALVWWVHRRSANQKGAPGEGADQQLDTTTGAGTASVSGAADEGDDAGLTLNYSGGQLQSATDNGPESVQGEFQQ